MLLFLLYKRFHDTFIGGTSIIQIQQNAVPVLNALPMLKSGMPLKRSVCKITCLKEVQKELCLWLKSVLLMKGRSVIKAFVVNNLGWLSCFPRPLEVCRWDTDLKRKFFRTYGFFVCCYSVSNGIKTSFY